MGHLIEKRDHKLEFIFRNDDDITFGSVSLRALCFGGIGAALTRLNLTVPDIETSQA